MKIPILKINCFFLPQAATRQPVRFLLLMGILAGIFAGTLTGCGQSADTTGALASGSPGDSNPAYAHSADLPDTGNSFLQKLQKEQEIDYYQDYQETGGEVALVTDRSSALDNGFNEAALNGAQTYARAAGISYSYYSAEQNSPEAYENVIVTAVENNARLIICAGSHFEQAVGSLQDTCPSVDFLLLDGVPRDADGQELPIASHVHCITYREEEAGYLAGYMAIQEGCRQLGFIGGEQLPSVISYGYGFLQGIDDAAADLDCSDTTSVNYWYSDTFYPDETIQEMAQEWYTEGTEIIFACGGSLYESVLAAADLCDGQLIGVDVDQSNLSKRFLTSAMKGIRSSVITALDDYYAEGGAWPKELAGQLVSYGADKKCISLPLSDDAWRFQNATADDYYRILAQLKAGNISISDDTAAAPETAVSVTFYNN